jgi:hypothetical protein
MQIYFFKLGLRVEVQGFSMGQLCLHIVYALRTEMPGLTEVDTFYWTVLAPEIVNLGREEQGSV